MASKEEKAAKKAAKQAAKDAKKNEGGKPAAQPAKTGESKKTPPADEKDKKTPPATPPKDEKAGKGKPDKTENKEPEVVEVEEVDNNQPHKSAKESAEAFANGGKSNAVATTASFDGSIGALAGVLGIGLNKGARLSADSQVNLLTLTWDVIKNDPDPTSDRAVTVKSMFHEMHGYVLTRAYVQMYYDGKALKVQVPDNVLKFALQTFNNFGIEVNPDGIKALGDGQTEIDFGKAEMDEAKRKKVAEENARQQATPPSMNPKDWKTVDEYKEGVKYILSQAGNEMSMNLFKAIEATMEWRKSQEKDPKDAHKWDVVPKGDIFDDMIKTLEEVPTILEGGIASTIRGYASVQGCPIGAHSRMRMYLPQYSEEDVASVTKAIIRTQLPKGITLDNYKPYNNLMAGTPETFLGFVENAKQDGPIKPALKFVENVYGKELGDRAAKDYRRKAVNKMIAIANLYRDPDARIAEYDEKGYAEAAKGNEEKAAPAGTAPDASKETPAAKDQTAPAADATGSESSEKTQKDKEDKK